jgi:hypothetical protein
MNVVASITSIASLAFMMPLWCHFHKDAMSPKDTKNPPQMGKE